MIEVIKKRAIEEGMVFEVIYDRIFLTACNGSDSVRIVITVDAFELEVYSQALSADINSFSFSTLEDAIAAFKMWECYIETVVKENFKNF